MTKNTAIIVDDSEEIQRVFQDVLEATGLKIIGKAYNGLEAVKVYQKKKPDFVFLDILMPKYDGVYALKEIKKIDSNAKIIVVTADVRETTKKQIIELGAMNLIYKPFKVKDIENLIKEIQA